MLPTKAPLPLSDSSFQPGSPVYFCDGRVLPVSVNLLAAIKGSAIMPGSFGTL